MRSELLKRLATLEQTAPMQQRFMNETEGIALANEIIILGINNIHASALLSSEQIYRMAQEYLAAGSSI
jgi:hypothetical protein